MNQNATNPIGIFDSGIGGLTVAKTVTELLPYEDIIYFGDTVHTPWGDKSTAAIQGYSLKVCDVLLQHHCKLIIIACHTASTAAFELVKEYVGDRAHVMNVIDPIIHHVNENHANKKIGLIGTKQTVRSNLYKKRLDMLNKNIEFSALATPLLVPLIEEGFADNIISETIVKEYLSRTPLTNIDALILGCTHYPLLNGYIQKFYHHLVDIIDASEVTAKMLKEFLVQHHLLNPNNSLPSKKVFYVSDYTEFFANTAKLFFPGDITLEPYPLWE